MIKQKVDIKLRGHVTITDQFGKTYYDDHNDISEDALVYIAEMMAENPSYKFSDIKVIIDPASSTGTHSIINKTTDGSIIICETLVPDGPSNAGEVTGLELLLANGLAFSTINGISFLKEANIALQILWKIYLMEPDCPEESGPGEESPGVYSDQYSDQYS